MKHKMVKLHIVSRHIRGAEYQPDTGRLKVDLWSGKVRQHHHVKPETIEALSRAESPGQFYIDNFKPLHLRLWAHSFALGVAAVVLAGILYAILVAARA